jgi:hypothetical protein
MSKANDRDVARYEATKRLVVELGFFRRGSVVRRFMPCGKPGCRCQAKKPQLHGPYYQWTRKVRGKTVTVRLSAQEAKLLQQWIANGRRLDRLVAQMEGIALRGTERLLKKLRTP